MAKKITTNTDEDAPGVSGALEDVEKTAAETPAAVIFKDGMFRTPDGCRFNTELKAQRHLKTIRN
jgi:hypothetical protein